MGPLLFLKPKNQKKTLAFVVVFVSICLLAQFLSPIYQAKASGATYYVSNCGVVGNDSNNGTSPSTPWLTIAKVNSSTFNPGDSILFNRGCVWREELTVPSSGHAGNPITFGAYGSGAMPEISGADIETGWTSESDSSGLTGDPNIQGYWMMENNFNDGTTNANNLSNNNGATFSTTTHQGSYSASFSSVSSQFLDRTDSSLSANFPGKSSNTAPIDFTMGAWVQLKSTSADMVFMYKENGYDLFWEKSDSKYVVQFYDGGCYTTIKSNTTYTDLNTWHHVVMRFKGTTTKELSLFIDGVKQTNTATTCNAGLTTDNVEFMIGGLWYSSFWNGLIDEAFAFNRVLSDTEIANIETNGLAGTAFTAYYKTLASQPAVVLQNGTPYTSVATKSALVPGTYWWDSVNSRLYIRTTGDINPTGYTMEASTRNLAVNPNGQDYFTLQNLYIYGAGAQTLFEGTSNHVILNDDRLGDSYFEGALFGSSSTRAMLGLGANQQLNYAYPIGATVQAGLISTLGGKVSLSDVDWSQVEPTEGVFNWSGPDAAAAACQATRMQCIFSIYGSPPWANGTSSSEFSVPTGSAFTVWVTAYTSFAQAAASRYHTSVKMWELWNEPNIYVFWQSPTNPSVSEYVTWGESVYSAMKAIDPTLQIVTQEGALNIGDGVTVIPGVTWLADLYADGFYADGTSIVSLRARPFFRWGFEADSLKA